ELKSLPLYPALSHIKSQATGSVALCIVLIAASLSWLIHGPLVDHLVPSTAVRIGPYGPGIFIMPPVLVKVLLTAIALTVVLVFLLRRPRHVFDVRVAATIVVATFAFVETAIYAHFKVNGPHTWTYPIPFGTHSYMNVPPAAMRPPSEEKLKAIATKLEG